MFEGDQARILGHPVGVLGRNGGIRVSSGRCFGWRGRHEELPVGASPPSGRDQQEHEKSEEFFLLALLGFGAGGFPSGQCCWHFGLWHAAVPSWSRDVRVAMETAREVPPANARKCLKNGGFFVECPMGPVVSPIRVTAGRQGSGEGGPAG